MGFSSPAPSQRKGWSFHFPVRNTQFSECFNNFPRLFCFLKTQPWFQGALIRANSNYRHRVSCSSYWPQTCFVNLTQVRVTCEEGTSVEELSPSHWPVGRSITLACGCVCHTGLWVCLLHWPVGMFISLACGHVHHIGLWACLSPCPVGVSISLACGYVCHIDLWAGPSHWPVGMSVTLACVISMVHFLD